MKRFLPLVAFIAMLLTLTACIEDNNNDYYNVAMGTLQKTNRQYNIVFDGETDIYAIPDSTMIAYRNLRKPGQRVIAMYNVISEGRGGGKAISLRDIFEVLTKDFVPAPTDESASKALGEDVTSVSEAWIAGGCLNVKFSMLTSGYSVKPHLINAYDTGLNDSDGNRIIEFRHHLNGNSPQYWSAFSYASFKLPKQEDRAQSYVLRFQYNKNEKRVVNVEN